MSLSPNSIRQRLEERISSFVDNPESLNDIFDNSPRLIIAVSNYCDKYCKHCFTDSTEEGKILDLEKFLNIPEEFFQLFEYVDIGRSGDPLLYKDLKDIIKVCHENGGIKEFTIAGGIVLEKDKDRVKNVIEDISKLKKDYDLSVKSSLTFHLYYPFHLSDTAKYFNNSLKLLGKISEEITIVLLGDHYFRYTSLKSVIDRFREYSKEILTGLKMVEERDNSFVVSYEDNQFMLLFYPTDVVFPLGRFRSYLESKGELDNYVKTLYSSIRRPVVCPDIGRWPGLVIEHTGDINLCGHFESFQNKSAIVANIFHQDFGEIEENLLRIYELEKEWVLAHKVLLEEGKISSCKLENDCYRKFFV